MTGAAGRFPRPIDRRTDTGDALTGTDRDLTGIEPELAAFVPHLPDLALDDVPAARAAGVELVRRAAAAAGPPDPSGLTTSEITIPVPGGPPSSSASTGRPTLRPRARRARPSSWCTEAASSWE